MERLIKDVRYMLLMLRKDLGFTVPAVLSIMLAISASTTIFSFVNAILLQAIPYENPNQLVRLFETFRKEKTERRSLSYPDYLDWLDQNRVFDQMAAYEPVSFTLSGDEPTRISGELASASYFQVLGVKPVSGRTFTPDEDRTPNSHPVAVISYGLWRLRFDSASNLEGKTLRLNEKEFSVVGVMPDGFSGLGGEAQIWIPMMMSSSAGVSGNLELRGSRWHQAVARMKPGVTIQRAQSDLDLLTRNIEQAYPNSNRDRGGLVVSLQDELFGPIKTVLRLLMAAVGFVLLIACANLANLLLVRATSRQRELAIRVALGATRRQLIQQLLTESIVLTLIGGLLGLVMTYVSFNLLKAYIPINLPSFVKVDLDFEVFAFALLTSIITGLACGSIPAVRASRPDPNDVLKEGGRGNVGRGQRMRQALVVTEVTLTLILTVGAGLTIGSCQQLQKINLGFKQENLITMSLSLPDAKYTDEKVATFSTQLTQNVKSLPSVQAVSMGSDSPLSEGYNAANVEIEGRGKTDLGGDVRIYRHRVIPGYLAATQIPLMKGRDFTNQDIANSPLVVIISDSMARRYWPSEDPIGKRIRVRSSNGQGPWISIVGVAGDAKFRTLTEPSTFDPDVYFPLVQFPTRKLDLLIRTSADPTNLIGAIRQEVVRIDPGLPVYDLMTMKQRFERQTAPPRFNVLLLSIFATIALVLAAIGVYGVMSHSMAQRTQEIGIRRAMGAQVGDILWLMLSQVVKLTVISLALGLIAVFSLRRALDSMLYGITTLDLTILILASITLVATTLVASFIPILRAVLINPMIALRRE
jgi:putative ABC transport system permease protein